MSDALSRFGTCPECGTSDEWSETISETDDYRDGLALSCPTCGFMIAGPTDETVERALQVLSKWSA